MRKNFHVLPRTTTYYHVLQQNVVFASRTANLACRPSYSTVLLFYYFTISLQIQYCRGRCLGLAARDAKKFSTYYHVLPHTTTYTYYTQNVVFASRTANLACRPSYSTVLLFYYFTISLQIQFCRGRCLGLAPRCKKVFHVLPRGWPSEMQKLCGRCLRLAVRDAKNSAADVCGWPSEMQKLCRRCLRFASRTANRKHRPQSFCISDGQPQTSVAEFLHLGRPTANIDLKVFASRTAIPACRPAFLHVGRTHPPNYKS